MKTLYLVRHAKSSWSNPGLADFDRPLNRRGERDAPEMGRRLEERKVLPHLLLSSPANRALATARIIAGKIGCDPADVATDSALYHADTSGLLKIIREQDDTLNAVMIFGHNPGLTDLATLLSGKYFENIPTCGILALEFRVSAWEQIREKQGEVVFYDYPKKPRERKFMS